MANALIALGGNLGENRKTLAAAFVALSRISSTSLIRRSQLVVTTPIGGPPGQGDFLNAAALLRTELSAEALLEELHAIEAGANRVRVVRWQARTLDLDLLLYDQEEFAANDLVVPHPRMSFRRFVLQPAVEIAPSFLHTTSGWTLEALLRHLDTAENVIAVGGENSAQVTPIYKALKDRFPHLKFAYDPEQPRAKLVIWIGENPPKEVLAGPTAVLPTPTDREEQEAVLHEAIAAIEATK
ncbi:MAG: 2-amino-4-hydroxy-6-hydroxymethyldihydropteridine diphosphokinase [Lacipirellulaceae bacterium]